MHDSVTELCLDQRDRWANSDHLPVEAYLDDRPSLRERPEAVLDLIYNEIVLREDHGQMPALEDYLLRFPEFATQLRAQFKVHACIEGGLLSKTRLANGCPSTVAGPPPIVAGYEIQAEIGRGGMGVVYRARQLSLNRLVALKMLSAGNHAGPQERERFKTEAEAVARLQHPNIVQIFEVGETHGQPFLALELAAKGTLADRLQALPLAPQAAAELIEILARAIHYAHQNQIVHRDLKPANVLFAKDGTPKITDFGLAKMLENDAETPRDVSRSSEPIGTPRYMSPEQAAGERHLIGPATDVYALGAILYECLTSQAPLVAASVVETMSRIQRDDPVPPRRMQPSIPRDLETICLHCLHKKSERRYASAAALADDLRRFLHGEPIHARRVSLLERGWKWCRRRPTQALLLAAGASLVVAAVAFVIVREQRLASVRTEVSALVKEGQDALDRDDPQMANAKFEMALRTVLAEPALRNHELYIRGWLNEGAKKAQAQQRWNQRRTSPRFDERRDEICLQFAFADLQQQGSMQAAREAIEATLAFATTPADREPLILLEADLLLRCDDAAGALTALDSDRENASRLWHARRAECLERLGRTSEGDQALGAAQKLAPNEVLESFLFGANRFQRHDWVGALAAFEKVLSLEPDQFAARTLQAACFLRLKRPSEAKVALTACVAHRPQVVWIYILRAEAYTQLEDYVNAAQDLQRASELRPSEPALQLFGNCLDALNKVLASLPADRRDALRRQRIHTGSGWQQLQDLPGLSKK